MLCQRYALHIHIRSIPFSLTKCIKASQKDNYMPHEQLSQQFNGLRLRTNTNETYAFTRLSILVGLRLYFLRFTFKNKRKDPRALLHT